MQTMCSTGRAKKLFQFIFLITALIQNLLCAMVLILAVQKKLFDQYLTTDQVL